MKLWREKELELEWLSISNAKLGWQGLVTLSFFVYFENFRTNHETIISRK